MYGGAAGGGKSDALLMAALQYVDVPGYAALILRRSFADLALPDAIMDRAKRWLIGRPGVRWDDQRKTFTFPSGATLTFGYLQYANDVYRYQGSAYQFIGFDELTQFEETQYTYLASRLRGPNLDEDPVLGAVPLRLRSTSNPGGIGHEWVKAAFIPQEDPHTGEIVVPRDESGDLRVFIPAKLEDNPSLNIEAYERNLALLPPVLRAQLRRGDWGARPPGEMFDRRWFRVETSLAGLRVKSWVRAWDLASTEKRSKNHDPDWSVGVLMGRLDDDRIVIADVRRVQARPGEVLDLIERTAQADLAIFGNRTIRIEQEPGSSGEFAIESIKKKLMHLHLDVEGVRSTGDKSQRAAPFASFASSGLILVLAAPWLPAYLDEIEGFPQEAVHDDQVDATSLAYACVARAYVPGAATVKPTTQPGQRSPYHARRKDVLSSSRERTARLRLVG